MPIGEIIGEGLGFVLRVVLQFVFEILLELPVRATGYGLLRLIGRRPDFGGTAVATVGTLFWIGVVAVVVFVLALRAG